MFLSQIRQYIHALFYFFQVLFISFRIWPLAFWFKFWISREEEIQIKIADFRFLIRNHSLRSKAVDLFTILECTYLRNYNRKNFEISKTDKIIEIGGHIGAFSVFAASAAYEGEVYIYEPLPFNYDQLIKHLKLNALKNIYAFNQAVWTKEGTVELRINNINSGAHSIVRKGTEYKECIEVPCLKLETIFQLNNIKKCDFLKLDCEGAEYPILLSVPIWVLNKIDKLVFEYHNYPSDLNNLSELYKTGEYLKKANFSLEIVKKSKFRGVVYAKKIKN